jgi:hypothetical protein
VSVPRRALPVWVVPIGAALISGGASVVPLAAQQRSIDAITLADLASGSLTSLGGCAGNSQTTGPGGGTPTVIAGLPSLPGSGPNASERQWYFSGSLGAVAALKAVGVDDTRRPPLVVAAARTHFVPANSCAFDAFLTARTAIATAAAVVAEARWFFTPGSPAAPALEAGIGLATRGEHAADAGIHPDATLRFAATTPNLYPLSVGPIMDRLLGWRSPKLEVRARIFGGGAVGIQREPGVAQASGAVSQVGGTGLFSLLHFPVSIVGGVTQALGAIPRDQMQASRTVGLAYRLNCCERNLWLVVRISDEAGRDIKRTSYSFELAHILLGGR